MRKIYTTFIVGTLFCASIMNSMAQVATNYTFSQSSSTYTPITGGNIVAQATGTSGVAGLDGNNFPGTIPFTFTFNGLDYTSYLANGNGHILFGTTTSNTTLPISTTNTFAGTISAIGRDNWGVYRFNADRTLGSNILTNVNANNYSLLQAGQVITGTGIPAGTTIVSIDQANQTITISQNATSTGSATVISVPVGEIREQTLGTAPNRIHVIQYSNFCGWARVNEFTNFQIRLYETSNKIEIIYGPAQSLATTSVTAQVGLRGATNADFNNRMGTTGWDNTVAGIANNSNVQYSPSSMPINGLTFSWELASCLTPSALSATGITTTSANLSWTPNGTETEWEIEWGPANFIQGTGNIVNVLNNPIFTLSGLTPSTGYSYFVRAVCGPNDFSVWSARFSFTTECNPFTIPTVVEGFETTALGAIPICWDRQQIVGTANWIASGTTFDIPNVAPNGGIRFVRLNWGVNNALLFTPGFDYSNITNNTRVRALFHRHSSAAATDLYRVYVNTTKSLSGATQIFELFSRTTTAPAVPSTGWYEYEMLIPASFHGEPIVYIIFEGSVSSGGSSYDLGLDNIIVDFAPLCLAPSGISLEDISNNTATISWTENGSATLWDIEYGLAGFSLGSGTQVLGVNDTLYQITGLSPDMSYDVYVRADCGGDQSSWAGPFSFVTCPLPLPLPFQEDFNASTTLPAGWDFSVSGNSNWFVGATHGNQSNGLSVNIWSLNQTALASLPLIGPLPANAILTFDYRIVNFSGFPNNPTTLGPGNFLFLVASSDCGYNFVILDTIASSLNHVPSTQFVNVSYDLSSLNGLEVNLGFFAQWASGDYYLNFDNINIITPPADLTDVTAAPVSVCAGEDVVLTADGVDGVVQWFDDFCGGNLIGTGASITVNPTATTTYFARNFNNGLPSANCLSVTVDVNAGIVVNINANGPLSFCDGQQVVLTADVPNPATPEIITLWNFNGSSTADVPGGPTSPQPAQGNGSASLVGGTTASFASGAASGGSSDPTMGVPPNYGWNITTFPAQGTLPQTAGVQFNVSTLGYTNIQFQFDQRFSNTSANTAAVLYNLDVTDVNSSWNVAEILAPVTTGDAWANQRLVDLSSIVGVANNPNLGIRIVSDFASAAVGQYIAANPSSNYSANGTWRFDMVTFIGTQLPNVSYLWSTGDTTVSITVTTAGTYSVEVTAASFCPGTSSVDVTVNPVFDLTEVVEICQGDVFTLPDNSTTDTAGVFVSSFVSVNGCDSTITTTVIVNPTFNLTFDEVVCFGETYELADGNIVDATGTYTVTVPSINACDSTITINLTVLPVLETVLNETICEGNSYTLADGSSVTDAGQYIVTVPSSNGCDSTITVNLTVLLNSTSSQTATICEGDSFELPDGTFVFNAGVYTTIIPAANGCDSIITTNLTVNPAPVVNLGGDISQENPPVTLDAGPGFVSYLWNTGATTQTILVTQSGDYSVTVTDANGCTGSDEVNVKFTASVAYLEGVGAVSIFPNPTSDKFNLSIQGGVSGDMRVEIININGQVVTIDMLRDITSSYNKFYEVSSLKPGIYNVRLITTEGQATLRLIVVR